MIRMILLGIGVVTCAHQAPSLGTSAGDGADRLTMEVASQRVPCTGEARTRCLRVERRRVPNPPADGSSFSYRLVRIVSRERERL